MKILSVNNTPVKLEQGDLIAIDSKTDRLYIMSEDLSVYVACTKASETSLEGSIYVDSAGDWRRQIHRGIIPDMKWIRYEPKGR